MKADSKITSSLNGSAQTEVPAENAKPSHEDIAKRAYEVYLRSGSKNGRCDRNWRRAERELRRRAGTPNDRAPAPEGNGYSEVLNGKRPRGDARLLDAVMRSGSRTAPENEPASEPASDRGPVCEPTVETRAGAMPGRNGGLTTSRRGAATGRRGSG